MAAGNAEQWLTEDGLQLLQGWARSGLTYEQIAKNMGVHIHTLGNYRNRYPAINEALRKGREVTDFEVENALYKRAIGYTVEETTVTDSEKDGHKVVTVVRHIPGDVTAQIFWLKNRKPDVWRDKKEAAIGMDIEDLSPLADLLK